LIVGRGQFFYIDPRGEILGGGPSLHPSVLLKSRVCSPLGVNEGMNIQNKGSKFTPKCKVLHYGENLTHRSN
jgi:hypothetical protein